MITSLQTRKPFIEWLQSKDPNEVVGVTTNKARGPIANFLIETQEGEDSDFVVNPTNLAYYNRGIQELFPFPDTGWVQQFIRRIDRLDTITAKQCLGYV